MVNITTGLFIEYYTCPQKAIHTWQGGRREISEYTQIIRKSRESNIQKFRLKCSTEVTFDHNSSIIDKIDSLWEYQFNGKLVFNNLSADFNALHMINKKECIPFLFTGTYKIEKHHKIELFWLAYLLGKVLGKPPAYGKVYTNSTVVKLKIINLDNTIIPILNELKESTSSKKNLIILNKHCKTCMYEALCETQAKKEDNLSLLNRMTPKRLKFYNQKGIFTIQQLSYLFKPPKKSKKLRLLIRHRLEIQALAIRNKKIYLQYKPEKINENDVELFIDFEGITDESYYYLFGVLVSTGGTAQYCSFWADSKADEKFMWEKFLKLLSFYSQAYIYHYGNYELKAIQTLSKRYNSEIAELKAKFINVNKFIYGKIYFPVYSNSLKDIAKHLGFQWSAPKASGLLSTVWRYRWQIAKDELLKNSIVIYNREDCEALKLLKDKLVQINKLANVSSDIEFANSPKDCSSEVNKEIQLEFDMVLKLSYYHYDTSKISFATKQVRKGRASIVGNKKGFEGQRKKRPKPTKIVLVDKGIFCPKHPSVKLVDKYESSTRLIIDLYLSKNGIRKSITRFQGNYGYCRICKRKISPPEIQKYGKTQLYGHKLKCWFVNQRVAHRLPYNKIQEMFYELFHEKISDERAYGFIIEFARDYSKTIELIRLKIMNSPFVHVDETPVNIRGETQYVWVFTVGDNVLFKHSKTRISQVAHDFFEDYEGVLISDFYTGYDSIPCKQQKCWVHLIREMNDDLRKNPFDVEYEQFLVNVRNLIVPIMETVQKYGLKKRNLNKFCRKVNVFYSKVIFKKHYKSELVCKYQSRFLKYESSLFTFLHQDNISWHNNTAEIALRHITKQEVISGYFHESVMSSYLTMLSIRQACRFQQKSFFRFLCSEEFDVDKYKERN